VTENEKFESPIEASLAAPTIIAGQGHQDSAPANGSSNSLHNRTIVFAMLFLVTGALGIPLLWMSPHFSKTERIVWAIVVTIYTGILLYIAYAIVMWSYREIFG
jgi:hypothetical protein